MTAGELTFNHIGKRVTVSGVPGWSACGVLVAVTHNGPNLGPGHDIETVLTLALDKHSSLSTVVVPPGSAAVVDE